MWVGRQNSLTYDAYDHVTLQSKKKKFNFEKKIVAAEFYFSRYHCIFFFILCYFFIEGIAVARVDF